MVKLSDEGVFEPVDTKFRQEDAKNGLKRAISCGKRHSRRKNARTEKIVHMRLPPRMKPKALGNTVSFLRISPSAELSSIKLRSAIATSIRES